MCGIAGIYRTNGSGEDPGTVGRMLERLERRGPDDQGTVRSGPVTLGNRRLAILDLTSAGHQPMRSADKRYIITFNGEIYNYKELLPELDLEASELRSTSDTEVILHAWQQWGEAALDRFVGQWAFALYDTREEILWLARDRFGEKPLYYYQNADMFAFASSIQSLTQVPGVPREIDRDALEEFLTLRYVIAPRTILRDIKKLPGGNLLRVSRNEESVRQWYRPRFQESAATHTPRDQLVEEFDDLLSRASKRCLVSDVPVALLLSDGIDSNSIRKSLAKSQNHIPAYTFRITGASDGPAQVLRSQGETEIRDILVSPDERIETLQPTLASLTEPTGDGAALATWLLIRKARDEATVFLCGHGGDEILGGYRLSQDRFRLSLLQKLGHLPQQFIGAPLDRFLYGDEPLSERRSRFLNASADRRPDAARYLIHRPLPPEDLAELLSSGPTRREPYLSAVDKMYEDLDESAGEIDRMQLVMIRSFLSENILVFADSVAMDSSAELRMPFLDRDLVGFVMGLPSRMRVGSLPGRTNTKLMLRWWGEKNLDPEIVRRRKRPFNFGGIADLMRSHRAQLSEMILGADPVRNCLPGIEGWLSRPAESYRGPWEGTLWAILALAVWSDDLGAS